MESIFILRHGVAEDFTDTKSDFSRKLTEEGIKKTKRLSEFFVSLNDEIDAVLTSPYVRAKETAALFVSKFHNKPEIIDVEFLSSGASCNEIIKGLQPYLSHKKVVLVGHAPDLEIFLGKLIGAEYIKLKKGALAKVNLFNSLDLSGELEYLVTSKVLKQIKIELLEKNIN